MSNRKNDDFQPNLFSCVFFFSLHSVESEWHEIANAHGYFIYIFFFLLFSKYNKSVSYVSLPLMIHREICKIMHIIHHRKSIFFFNTPRLIDSGVISIHTYWHNYIHAYASISNIHCNVKPLNLQLIFCLFLGPYESRFHVMFQYFTFFFRRHRHHHHHV